MVEIGILSLCTKNASNFDSVADSYLKQSLLYIESLLSLAAILA